MNRRQSLRAKKRRLAPSSHDAGGILYCFRSFLCLFVVKVKRATVCFGWHCCTTPPPPRLAPPRTALLRYAAAPDVHAVAQLHDTFVRADAGGRRRRRAGVPLGHGVPEKAGRRRLLHPAVSWTIRQENGASGEIAAGRPASQGRG